MRERLLKAVRGHNAQYVELRLEESENSRLAYRGELLEDIASTVGRGGCARALVNGGWGIVSFNDYNSIEEMVALAVKQAGLVQSGDASLAPVTPQQDTVAVALLKDPHNVPLAEKVALFGEYNRIMLGHRPAIQTTATAFADSRRRQTLVTSEGSYIEQESLRMRAVLAATARDGTTIEQAHHTVSSSDDYGKLETLHAAAEDVARRATALLSATPVKGGEYTVVLDNHLAGVFAHEAFGHLSEADHVYENPSLRETLVLGRRFGGKHLGIVDGAALPNERGSYKYDDEGVPSTVTHLIKEGVLVARLHSRETAARMGEPLTGNARAINYRHAPIVRMTNTYIEPGKTALDDLFAEIKEGVYCRDSFGGETSMEMFTFSAGEAFMIRNGKLAEPLRGVLLSGNVFTTLANIDAVADDLHFGGGGNCGKGGQSGLPVGIGSPHIRIQKCLVGGR